MLSILDLEHLSGILGCFKTNFVMTEQTQLQLIEVLDQLIYLRRNERWHDERDPWLVFGQVCEIITSDPAFSRNKFLGYFLGFDSLGSPVFSWEKPEIGKSMNAFLVLSKVTSYRPIGTIWDFAPDWATYLRVDNSYNSEGNSYFSADKRREIWLIGIVGITLKPGIYPRPKWAIREEGS